MFAHGIHGINRTGWRKTTATGRAKKERLRRRNRPAINANRQNEEMLQRVHVLVFEQARTAERGQKIFFHAGKILGGNRVPRHQHQFHRPDKIMLVLAESFPEQTTGTAAGHGIADFSAGDDPQPGRSPFRQLVPIGDQAAEHNALAPLPDTRKIATLREPRGAAQTQAFRRGIHKNQTGVRRLRPTRRRLAKVALPRLVELRFRNPCWRLRRIFDG